MSAEATHRRPRAARPVLVVEHRVQRPRPVAGDLDQPDAGPLQPVGDPFGLLDAGRRQRVRRLSTVSAVARTARATACGTSRGVATPMRPAGRTGSRGSPSSALLAGGDDLGAAGQAADPVEPAAGPGQRLQSGDGWWPPPRTAALDQPVQPRLHRPAPPAGRPRPAPRGPARRSRRTRRGRSCRRTGREHRPMPASAQALVGWSGSAVACTAGSGSRRRSPARRPRPTGAD